VQPIAILTSGGSQSTTHHGGASHTCSSPPRWRSAWSCSSQPR
jgi:hypothetical protein